MKITKFSRKKDLKGYVVMYKPNGLDDLFLTIYNTYVYLDTLQRASVFSNKKLAIKYKNTLSKRRYYLSKLEYYGRIVSLKKLAVLEPKINSKGKLVYYAASKQNAKTIRQIKLEFIERLNFNKKELLGIQTSAKRRISFYSRAIKTLRQVEKNN